MLRALAIGLCLSACAGPLEIELASGALDPEIRTLIIALESERGVELVVIDRDVTDDAEIGDAIPTLSAWTGAEARYVVLGFEGTAEAVNLRTSGTGPTGKLAGLDAQPTLVLERSLVRDEVWRPSSEPPSFFTDLALPLARPLLVCAEGVGLEWPTALDLASFEEIAATGPDSAVIFGGLHTPETVSSTRSRASSHGRVFLLRDGTVVETATGSFSRFSSAVFDGSSVWATTSAGVLVQTTPSGELVRVSAPGEAWRVVQSTGGRVFAFNVRGVYPLSGGSSAPMAGEGYPLVAFESSADDQRLAVSDEGPVFALDAPDTGVSMPPGDGTLFQLRSGTWTRVAPPPDDPNRIKDILYDDGVLYALTAARLYRRVEGRWEPLEGAASLERIGMHGLGEQRIAVHGIAGFVELRPVAGDVSRFCSPRTGTIRNANRISIDPTRTSLFGVDTYERVGTMGGPMLLRIPLPR